MARNVYFWHEIGKGNNLLSARAETQAILPDKQGTLMSNAYFAFKRFTVRHDRCAMKVGTDGVLLGAWADVSSARHMLDAGTGTGLIALMLAQRCDARVRAIDIDADAVEQARENVAASPWPDRITVERQDIRTYDPGIRFDVIVSNPPYFAHALNCPDRARNTARHADQLEFESLAATSARLLAPEGKLSVILPADRKSAFDDAAKRYGFELLHGTWVRTKPDAEPKRVLLSFGRFPGEAVTDELAIEGSDHVYSKEYVALTRDIYLHVSSVHMQG